jgi:hypothetical protein
VRARRRPVLSEFAAIYMDERWVNRSPETMLGTFRWFGGDGFGLMVEDLLRLPREPGVIVWGFRLLPHLVKPLLAMPSHVVWLLPTPGFRRAAFDSRGSWRGEPCATCSSVTGCSPDAFSEDMKCLEPRVIEADTTMTEVGLAGRVTEAFAL